MSESVERVRATLIAAGHPDTITMFPEGTRTAQDAADAVGCTVAQIAKSIVLRAGEQPLLVIASGANRVDLCKIAAAVGQPVKPADGRWVRDTVGYAIGGIAPIGHDRRLRVFIDADLLQHDPIWAAAGTPRHVFRTTTRDIARMTAGTVTDVKEG